MLERNHEERLKRWCHDRGILCLKLVLMNQRGFPDRTIVLKDGRILFLELKKDAKSRISPTQTMWLRLLRSYGFVAERADSFDDAITIIQGVLDATIPSDE